ncbi:MAG TPA: XRE family transcriptional regulator [Longimicrobiaceae bacterium]|nr:XRE family transcriptional regulator [Longimicrobiaceae bacterium]
MNIDPDLELDDHEEIYAWESGSNLFAEAGLPNAAEQHAHSELFCALVLRFQDEGLSNLQVAEALGTSEAVAAALMGGEVEQFSMSQLFAFLDALGCDAKITLEARTPGRRISMPRKAKARR